MRPVSLKVGTGDFALAAGHRRNAMSLVAGTLNSAAAFSIAVASSLPPSFDDLVGDGKETRRAFDADSLGGPKIDDELELCGLLHR